MGPKDMSSLSSITSTRGFQFGVVLHLDWLPTKAAEPSLPKDVWLFIRKPFYLSPSERSEVPNLRPMSVA